MITLKADSGGHLEQNSEPLVLNDLLLMREAHNYNNWLFNLVRPYLGIRVLEVGPGIGNITQHLVGCVDYLVGVEPDKYCIDYLRANFPEAVNISLINKAIQACEITGLIDCRFDTVLCMNVLEHVENDRKVLEIFRNILPAGGRVVLLVPAVRQAYGPIDAAVGHFRRYTKSTLKELLSGSSLQIEKQFYSNFPGLMGWWFNSKIRRITRQNSHQIMLFDKLVPVISFLESIFGCPVGQSLISISRVAG